MEKKSTLREQYEEINKLLKETKNQRDQFSKASEKINKRIISFKRCSKILFSLSEINFGGFIGYCRYSSDPYIKTKVEVTFYDERIKESDMPELQEILDNFSPEKVKITKITEGDLTKTNKPSIIEVELVG